MFQLPVIDRSSRNRKRRKIRYQYINSLKRKYDQLNYNQSEASVSSEADNVTNGILTPENSESSEAEAADLEKKHRRKRRLQSVLGNALDSSDEELDGDEDGTDENDPETQFYESHIKPQHTFEVWNVNTALRTPIQRKKITYNAVKKLEKAATKSVTKKLNYQTKKLNMYFQALKFGFDVYPKPQLSKQKTMHLAHLNQLLYTNVLNQNWEIAYRCFSILIRLEDVDVRSLWSIGSEILNSLGDTQSNEAYLEWLAHVFPSRVQFNQGTNYSLDPVFRCGSRTHTPTFVLTWLWTRLFIATSGSSAVDKEKFLQSLIDRLDEMVLSPPYMDDSEIWYIFGLTHLVMASELSSKFRQSKDILLGSRADIARNQVIQHINNAKNCLQMCKANSNYEFPENVIEHQLVQLERSLYTDELSVNCTDESAKSSDEDGIEHSYPNEDSNLPDVGPLDTQQYEIENLIPEVESAEFTVPAPIRFGYESD
ncbi:Rrn11p [Kluyveromyces lactis]|uniref:KLLA0C05852p n=1 Tax=Kluyveromyces lactis (strain ATCC 8585 / CBS 2359 / DSM 70799 / NBRC 1267 / NRRL Y-1140 / WM37) TaxID=284590 RepID=Q6CUD1_KLULA|nr:uncharacterized protein KLLA0_C05852g [Kluyveromyces lactis]CAH01309.1 KLLA0C05852p [Kluyveromyces lactis]|eukprot:XP_452458.1 uncharacterized protein KLLA0_C05852g [Kluyveromyces lactis]